MFVEIVNVEVTAAPLGMTLAGLKTHANEGLALLPAVSGAPMPRTRKLLELETEGKRAAR